MSLKRADLGQIATFVDVDPSVTILAPGENASVHNQGTTQNMMLKFSIPKGDKGDKGDTGAQGPKGDEGKPFKITKTYPTVAEMNEDYSNIEEGAFVVIAGVADEKGNVNVDDPDVGKLYVRNANKDTEGEKYTFLTDLSGAQGMKGDTGAQGPKGEDGIDGIDGKTYKYWFEFGNSGHLFVFYDDEAKDPSGNGMPWKPWDDFSLAAQ